MKPGIKLLTLLSIITLTGCSSPVKYSSVTQSVWDSYFNDSYADFFAQNVTIEVKEENDNYFFELEENLLHVKWYDGSEEYYTINKVDDNLCTYERLYQKGDKWVKDSDKDSFESLFINTFGFFYGYSFYKQSDFAFENNMYTYKEGELECAIYSWGPEYQSDIKIGFSGDKLVSLSFQYRFEKDAGLIPVEVKYSKYGKTEVTIPDVVETPLFTLDVEQGLNISITPYGALTVRDGNVWNPNGAQLTDMSFNHNTLYGSQQLGDLNNPINDYNAYRAFKFGLTVDENTKLDLSKCLTTAYPAMVEGGLNSAKSLRIGFIMETGSFVYAPLQVKEKCSYSDGINSEPAHYNEGEIYDTNSQDKISLPANKEIFVVTWFDGWDENCVNEAVLQEVFVTLGFSK